MTMFNRIFLPLSFALLVIGFQCYAQSVEDLVSPENYALLINDGGRTSNVGFKTAGPVLSPACDTVRLYTESIFAKLKPAVVVENLSIIKKDPTWKTGLWNEAEKLKLLNEVTSISSLSGLQYYSASRKQMRTFYETSYIIDTPVTRQKLGDPLFNNMEDLPKEFVFFARQKDLSFGDNIYRYEYHINDNSIFFTQQNETSMFYGIFPVLAKQNLFSIAAIINCDDVLLVYLITMAKAPSIPGMEQKISNSFSTRCDALLSWLGGKDFSVNTDGIGQGEGL